MKNRIVPMLLSATFVLVASPFASAEVSVKLTKMHLCCGACVKGVEEAVKKVDGATVKVDKDAAAAVVTAPDQKVARRALGAIGRAGFHGQSDHDKLKMRDNSGVKEGKVERLELVGIHNCCPGCNKAIQAAIATVDGVQADTAKSKKRSLVVEGNFDGLAVIKALNDAGFHVRSKQAAQEAAAARKKKADNQ